jgi:hypothetical protein
MKTLLLILLTFFSFQSFAQVEEPVVQDPEVKTRIDAARAAYITERLGLTTEESEKFWPIYREFADKRNNIRSEYRDARRGGKDETELVDLGLKLKQQELDLEKDYSGRMMRVISAQKLIELRGAERDFTRIILQQIQQRKIQQDRRQQLRDRQQQQLQKRNN